MWLYDIETRAGAGVILKRKRRVWNINGVFEYIHGVAEDLRQGCFAQYLRVYRPRRRRQKGSERIYYLKSSWKEIPLLVLGVL